MEKAERRCEAALAKRHRPCIDRAPDLLYDDKAMLLAGLLCVLLCLLVCLPPRPVVMNGQGPAEFPLPRCRTGAHFANCFPRWSACKHIMPRSAEKMLRLNLSHTLRVAQTTLSHPLVVPSTWRGTAASKPCQVHDPFTTYNWDRLGVESI